MYFSELSRVIPLSLVKFVIVGLIATMGQWGIAFVCFKLFSGGYVLISCFSYFITASIHYLMLGKWVFVSAPNMFGLMRFGAMVGAALLLGSSMFLFMLQFFDNPYVIQVVVSCGLVFFNYFFGRCWVFLDT